MQFFDETIDSLKDFFHNNSRLTVTIILVLVFFSISAFTVSFIYAAQNQPKKTVKLDDLIPQKAVEEFFIPAKEPLTEEYYFYRTTKDKWSKEEIDRWFTFPDEKSVESLRKANQKISNDITGAAP